MVIYTAETGEKKEHLHVDLYKKKKKFQAFVKNIHYLWGGKGEPFQISDSYVPSQRVVFVYAALKLVSDI